MPPALARLTPSTCRCPSRLDQAQPAPAVTPDGCNSCVRFRLPSLLSETEVASGSAAFLMVSLALRVAAAVERLHPSWRPASLAAGPAQSGLSCRRGHRQPLPFLWFAVQRLDPFCAASVSLLPYVRRVGVGSLMAWLWPRFQALPPF